MKKSFAGDIHSKTTDFGLIQYGYDALDRLVLADYDWKADETFAYDAVGNRTADAGHPVWHYDAANQLLAYGDGAHDPAGQTPPTVPAFTFAYDANGSTVSKTDLASGTTDQYGYNFDNRMSEVWRNGDLIAQYFYDHSSQRVRKDLYTGGVLTEANWFVYGHEGLLVEYDGSGSILKKYTWHPDKPWSTNPIYQVSVLSEEGYFICDHLFTPYKIVDCDFKTTWQTDWQSFGELNIVYSDYSNTIRFPGQYYDCESYLHFNLNRFFSSSIGRYFQVDPLKKLSFSVFLSSSIDSYLN